MKSIPKPKTSLKINPEGRFESVQECVLEDRKAQNLFQEWSLNDLWRFNLLLDWHFDLDSKVSREVVFKNTICHLSHSIFAFRLKIKKLHGIFSSCPEPAAWGGGLSENTKQFLKLEAPKAAKISKLQRCRGIFRLWTVVIWTGAKRRENLVQTASFPPKILHFVPVSWFLHYLVLHYSLPPLLWKLARSRGRTCSRLRTPLWP